MPNFLFWPDLGPNCLQRLSADNISKLLKQKRGRSGFQEGVTVPVMVTQIYPPLKKNRVDF